MKNTICVICDRRFLTDSVGWLESDDGDICHECVAEADVADLSGEDWRYCAECGREYDALAVICLHNGEFAKR